MFRKIDDYRWELPKTGAMRVPGLLFASEGMLEKFEREKVAEQVANVATLPGIVGHSMAMPDAHWGYGFPVGGVAATDAEHGVISPGGIGYDISCGVRLLRTDLTQADLDGRISPLMDALFAAVPSGVGQGGRHRLDEDDMRQVFRKGARWAVEHAYGDAADLLTCEDGGALSGVDPHRPSERALERGRGQLGTLGSGNHFLEVQVVDHLYEEKTAAAFGLFEGQVTVLIHTGSRGCGYQICEDSLRTMEKAARRHNIALPDRQLACAPVGSDEGKAYFNDMCAGANFARANRQVITHEVRKAFTAVLGSGGRGSGFRVVYDVCHNIGKIEEHEVGGRKRKLLVHRKGATRAFPAGHPEVPEAYRAVGQPVLIPGTMGTFSYVLVGTEQAMKETFGTTAHGAGRRLSRTAAAKQVPGARLLKELKALGVEVRTDNLKGLAEEAPIAYKDVSEVVDVCHNSGISRRVARMRPLGVVKG